MTVIWFFLAHAQILTVDLGAEGRRVGHVVLYALNCCHALNNLRPIAVHTVISNLAAVVFSRVVAVLPATMPGEVKAVVTDQLGRV